MAEWDEISLQIPGFDALDNFTDGLSSFLSNLSAVNQDVIFPVLRTLSNFRTRQDLTAKAAQAALDAVRDILADFTKDAAGYLLIVPVLKPFARAVGPPDLVLQDIEDLATLNTIINPTEALVGDGGNYGLYRKIVESIYDRADLSRPDFPQDAYISGAILVFGSDTYLDTISGLLTLQDLFGNSVPLPLDNFSIPVPQNIKARPISVSNRKSLSGLSVIDAEVVPALGAPQTPPPFDIHVTWDPEPAVRRKPAYGRFLYYVESWSLYIKEAKKIRQGEGIDQYKALTVDVLTTDVPIVDQVFTGTVYQAVVQNLDPEKAYWVSVAYTVRVVDQDQETEKVMEPTFQALSAQRRVRLQEQAPITQFVDGQPPDWLAITSPLAPFPQLRQLFAQAQTVLDLLETTFVNVNNTVSDQLDFLEDQLEALAELIDELSNVTGLVQNTFDSVDIGIWTATFQGRGGAPFFVSTIGELLLDPATVNRPPFDRGDEAIGAMVLLNVSETAAGGEDFLALLDTFLGESGADDGFTVNDINRIPREEEPESEEAEEGPTPLADLGLSDEDPC